MWLETMVGKLAEVPALSTGHLAELRAKDRKSRDLVTLITEEETKLFESLKTAQKEQGHDFDEAPYVAQARELLQQRAALVALLEEQGKQAQALYAAIDTKIDMFDKSTAGLEHLVNGDPAEASVKKRKKRKKNQAQGQEADAADFAGFGEEAVVDPNEPVYCTCRMVSFGKMVGCENAECTVEWFHLACVGLSLDDPTPDCWYCPDCRAKLGMD